MRSSVCKVVGRALVGWKTDTIGTDASTHPGGSYGRPPGGWPATTPTCRTSHGAVPLQRLAMTLPHVATCMHDGLLGRPAQNDTGSPPSGNKQERGRPSVRREP